MAPIPHRGRSSACRNGQDYGFERDRKEDRTDIRIYSEDGTSIEHLDQGTESEMTAPRRRPAQPWTAADDELL
jgi:hypothetical protein